MGETQTSFDGEKGFGNGSDFEYQNFLHRGSLTNRIQTNVSVQFFYNSSTVVCDRDRKCHARSSRVSMTLNPVKSQKELNFFTLSPNHEVNARQNRLQ